MIEVQIGEAASYAAAGVNIDAGDKISRLWNEASQETFNNRAEKFGQLAVQGTGFTDIRAVDLDMIQGKFGLTLGVGVDGVGTKPELAERATERREMARLMEDIEERDHSGIFHDLVAMVADDFSRDGGEPLIVASLFDTSTLTHDQAEKVVVQLCKGVVDACKRAGVVSLNGETAELGDRVGGYKGAFNYNLGGFAVGSTHKSRILDGSKIRPGDKVVALREDGFRANGMSLVRKVLKAQFGELWHLEDEDLASQALRPSIIYTPAFVDMHGGYDIDRKPGAVVNAIAHVTGGGIPGKLQRKLAMTGCGAILSNLFDPPEIMLRVQDWSMYHNRPENDLTTPDESAYQSLNMGNGALVVTPQPEQVMAIAEDWGIESRVAGRIVEVPGIQLRSRGVTHRNNWIHFIPRAA